MLRKFVCYAQQVSTSMRIGKCSDAKTVGRIKLPLQKLTADVLDFCQMQQTGGWQQSLNITLFHRDVGGVAKVYQQLHGCFINVSDSYFCLSTFCQLPSEHGVEVWATCWQDHSVGKDFFLSNNENNIAQFSVFSQDIDGFQSVSGVLIRGVTQASRRWGSLHGISWFKAIHLW